MSLNHNICTQHGFLMALICFRGAKHFGGGASAKFGPGLRSRLACKCDILQHPPHDFPSNQNICMHRIRITHSCRFPPQLFPQPKGQATKRFEINFVSCRPSCRPACRPAPRACCTSAFFARCRHASHMLIRFDVMPLEMCATLHIS